jgi:hypothetical protein
MGSRVERVEFAWGPAKVVGRLAISRPGYAARPTLISGPISPLRIPVGCIAQFGPVFSG